MMSAETKRYKKWPQDIQTNIWNKVPLLHLN